MPPVTHIAEARPFPADTAGEGRCARLAGVFEALPAAVLLLDGRGRVVEVNAAARGLFDDSLVGRPWREVVAEQFHGAGGTDLRLRDGRLLSLATRPLEGQPGQLLMFSEVTTERRMAQALGQHKRLIDMGRMAASLAHQIRTPLSAATLYLSKLADPRADIDSARSRRFSAKALERLCELERLIRDMLLFARGERGRVEPVMAGLLLEQALEPMATGLRTQGVAIELDGEALECELWVNPTLLSSALQNLINNAAEALAGVGEAGARIRLLAETDGDAVRLVVEDNGPGIPSELREAVFEPFISHRAGGTGLGLAVVQAVARAHHGRVLLEPTADGGSRFSLRLPTAAGNEHEKTRAGSP